MSCQLTKLNSMRDHDIQELVWENGQLVLRSLSKITQKKPPWDGERSRYQTADSVSGNSLLGLYGRIHQYNKPDSSYPNCMHDGSLQHMDDSFELLHERCCYTKRLMDSHVVSVQKFANHKHDRGCCDKQLIDSQVFPFANHKKDYASKVFEGIQHKTTSNGEVPQSSLQQCQDSVRLMRSSIPVDSIPGNAAKSVRNLQNKPSSVPTKLNATKPGPEPPNESIPDEQSVAVGCKDDPTNKKSSDQVHGQSLGLTENISKEKPSNRESIAQQLIASSSTYSHGASNNPRFSLKRKYKYTEGSGYVCEKQNKRKMHALQELIPNCNKVDEVAILDDAIEYIKILQLQLQMISMRSGLFMPPLMLPMTMQQINTPHFAYPPKVAGMDTTRMQMGLGCCPVQFPISSFSGATAPAGITENRLGYPGQVLPISISGSPFVSFPGGPSIHSVPKFDKSQVPAPMELQCSALLSGEKKSEP